MTSVPGRHPRRPSVLRSFASVSACLSAAALSFVLHVGTSEPACAATFYVDGSNPTCSNSGPGTDVIPYCTISAAVAANKNAGTTVLVRPAVYREMVTIATSGTAASPYVVQATDPGVIIDGAENLSAPALWAPVGGDVWLAATVNWSPKQVFMDGARLPSSTLAPASLPPGSYRYVSGTGLYVNAGGGTPGAHQTFADKRAHGFKVSGRSWIVIEGFTVTHTQDRGIYLSSFANHCTIKKNTVEFSGLPGIHASNCIGLVLSGNKVAYAADHGIYLSTVSSALIEDNVSCWNALPGDKPACGVLLTNTSSGNTLSRNCFFSNRGTGLKISTQSYSNTSCQNMAWANGEHGFDHSSAPGTEHISDVASHNGLSGFSFQSNSGDGTLHNSISVNNGVSGSGYNLTADITSCSTLVADYNILWNGTIQKPVKWGKSTYATIAAYTAASLQDSNSTQADPMFLDANAGLFHPMLGSPAIDAGSADHFPGTDFHGRPPYDEPITANAGAGDPDFADRGACEYIGPGIPPVAVLEVSPASGNAPLEVEADATNSHDHNGTVVSYWFDFGDGTVLGPQPQPTAAHHYDEGEWTALVVTTDNDGQVDTARVDILVTGPNAAPDGRITGPTEPHVMIASGQAVRFFATVSDPDGPTPLTHSWDFGGGESAAADTVEDPGAVIFDVPGTYTVTYTPTDGMGLPDAEPDTRLVTVRAPAPDVEVDGIHWTFSGPTSVTFDWRGTDNLIRYGLTDAYGMTTRGTPPVPYPFSSGGPYWEARINGLLPDTEYHYSIAGGEDHTFHTLPTRGTSGFTVFVEGDIGSTLNYPVVAEVQEQIAADSVDGADFCLVVGDLSYADAKGQPAVDQHFNDMMAWSQDAAYMPTWGNHEWGDPDNLTNYKGRFDLPNPQTSPGSPAVSCCGEDWYWFDYGNVRFIAYPEPWAGAFADWNSKASVLMQQADADTAIDFVVTFGHRPAYSSGHHSGDNALKGYLDALGATYTKYVLNLNGHSHNYERSHPQQGVIHVTSGTGGATLEPASGTCKWAGGCPPPAWSAFRAMHYVTFRLDVYDGAIVGRAICGPAGNLTANDIVCEQYTVIDSFVIGTRPDLPPVVSAPDSVRGLIGAPLTVNVTAADPDGEPIVLLTADLSGLPAGHGATFAADSASGTLTWIPTAAGGPFLVSFAAGNALSGSATTAITVTVPDPTPVNLARNPSFETATTGWNANGVGAAITRVTGGHEGGFAVEVRGPANTTSFGLNDSPNVVSPTASPGTRYRFSAWVRSAAHTGKASLKVREYLNGVQQGATINSPTVDLSPVWQRITVDAVATVAGGTLDFQVVDKPLAASEIFQVDDILVHVVAPPPASNQPPVATLAVQPLTGVAPLTVTASGTGSTDPEGRPLAYRFDFGDGTVVGPQASPTASHTYAAGSWPIQLIVTDERGAADTASALVTPLPNLVRNPSFEAATTGWNANGSGTPTIARVAGGHDGGFSVEARSGTGTGAFGINDAPNWVSPHGGPGATYRFTAWVRSASHTGKAWIRVREFLNGVAQGAILSSPMVTLSPTWQLVTMEATAAVIGGTFDFQVVETPNGPGEVFQIDNVAAYRLPSSLVTAGDASLRSGASAEVEIVRPFGVRFYPNPPNAGATLDLVTTRTGSARVLLYDTQGRVVRTLLDDRALPAGRHVLRFETRGPGQRMGPGMYFYRVEAAEGRVGGKFAILE